LYQAKVVTGKFSKKYPPFSKQIEHQTPEHQTPEHQTPEHQTPEHQTPEHLNFKVVENGLTSYVKLY